ncbi:hypothetical protein CO724_04485 [Ectopseudomonas mendocina]|nr:hypothetical protein CO724_04485 [Pseudomonas mendocina]
MRYVQGVGLRPDGVMDVTAANLAKRSIMAGTIAGLGVAISGGNEDASIEAFIRGGGMMLIQDGYRQMGHDLVANSRVSTKDSFCTETVPAIVGPNPPCAPPRSWFKQKADGSLILDDRGRASLDYSKVDPAYQWVGKGYGFGQGPAIISEAGVLMTMVSKIPGMNGMALMHDSWVAEFHLDDLLGGAANQLTIAPAIILHYGGTEACRIRFVRALPLSRALRRCKRVRRFSPKATRIYACEAVEYRSLQ